MQNIGNPRFPKIPKNIQENYSTDWKRRKNTKTNTNIRKNTNLRIKKIIKLIPLEEDTDLHKKMLKEIKNPVWKKYDY